MATEASMLFAKMEEKIYYHTTVIISQSVLYESPSVFLITFLPFVNVK